MKKLNSIKRIELYEALIDCVKNNVSFLVFFNKAIELNIKVKNKAKANLYEGMMAAYKREGDVSSMFVGIVPNDELTIISLSIESGNILDGMERALELCQLKKESISSISSALIGPVVMISFVFAMVGGYSIMVFPEFEPVLPVEEWPIVSSSLYSLGKWIFSFKFLVTMSSFIFLCLVIAYYVRNGKNAFRDRFGRLPVICIFSDRFTVVFLGILSGMIRLNIPISSTFVYISESTNSGWLQEHMRRMRSKQNEGVDLGEALNTGMLSLALVAKLAMYSESADITEGIHKIYQSAILDLKSSINKTAASMKTVATLTIAVIAVWIYMSIFSLSNAFS